MFFEFSTSLFSALWYASMNLFAATDYNKTFAAHIILRSSAHINRHKWTFFHLFLLYMHMYIYVCACNIICNSAGVVVCVYRSVIHASRGCCWNQVQGQRLSKGHNRLARATIVRRGGEWNRRWMNKVGAVAVAATWAAIDEGWGGGG